MILNPVSFENISEFSQLSLSLYELSDFEEITELDIRETFLNPKEFAPPVSYVHLTGESESYNAIFDNPHSELTIENTKLTDRTVTITVEEKILKRKPVKGDTFKKKGVTYTVYDFQPDGVGLVIIKGKRN